MRKYTLENDSCDVIKKVDGKWRFYRRAKGMCMEACGSDELISKERGSFLDFAGEQRDGITVNVCANPAEEIAGSILYKADDEPEKEEQEQKSEENGKCVVMKNIRKLASWQDIADKIKKNTDGLNVGDTVTCELTDGTQTIFVVTDVKNEYVRFESKDFIGSESVSWNEDDTNRGGYPDSEIRKYMDSVIWNLLPEELQAVISDVDREWKDKDGNCGIYTTKLFLPEASEVFDKDNFYGDKGLYEQLEYYKSGRNRIRVDEDGDTRTYWLASVRPDYSTYACIVDVAGNADSLYASIGTRVPLCFLISRI